jgi:hypothetical protein
LGKKLQQYYIMKLKTSRLKKANYNMNLTISQARLNSEIISLGDSQMLRSLRQIKGIENSQENLNNLFNLRKKLKNSTSNEITHDELLVLETTIDSILFVNEIISIVIDDNRHYQTIVDNGLVVNGKNFVRLLCGAGNARRNTVIMVDEEFEQPLKELLQNGYDKSVPLIPSKYSAYLALASSATLQVSNQYFCVVPDCIVEREEEVDFVQEGIPEDQVVRKKMMIKMNVFDGQGLISPRGAKQWANDLELDYIPSNFIIRNSFIKGAAVVFDFHKLSEEVGVHIIKDLWGNEVNIRDIDLIISESQFKLASSYSSQKEYEDKCKKNGMSWGISRVPREHCPDHVFTNYQFLQILNLDDKDIKNLCAKTLDYFSGAIKDRVDYLLLYLLGRKSDHYNECLLDEKLDNATKAIILNTEMAKDEYIQNYVASSLAKKIKESYKGDLLVDGNYQVMISDPYAQAQHVLGLEVEGLLHRGEHYSNYWNEKKVKIVSACRAPLTWVSENNVLNLVNSKKIYDWYRYLTNGIVFNIHGNDTMLAADADFDGDVLMTSNQKELIDCAQGGLPVTYETHPVPKSVIDESTLYKADMLSFNSKIGFITNVSTTMYSMLPNYEENSPEYKEILKRILLCRKEQGLQIDRAKGLETKLFPKHWTNWERGDKFNNSILVDKRPYFFRHIYTDYNRKYLKFEANYENFSLATFGEDIDVVSSGSALGEVETEFLNKYERYKPLIDSECVMNRICHYMESETYEIKRSISPTPKHVIAMMKNEDLEVEKGRLKELYKVYEYYKSTKRNFANMSEGGFKSFSSIEQYNKHILQKCFAVCPDISELATLAVIICYEIHPSDNKRFAWDILGEGIVSNILKHRKDKLYAPFRDDSGGIAYLGKRYSMKEVLPPMEEAIMNWSEL